MSYIRKSTNKDEIKGEFLMEHMDDEVKEKYGEVEGSMEIFLRGTRVTKVEVDLNSLESKVPRSEYVKEGQLVKWGWYGDWYPTTTRLIEDPNQDYEDEDEYDDVVLNDWLDEICSIRREIINGRRLRNVYLVDGCEGYTSIEDTPTCYDVNTGGEYQGNGLRKPDYFDSFINRWRTNSEDKDVLVGFLEQVITYVKNGRERYSEDGYPRYSTDVIFEEKNYLDHLPEKKGKLRQMLGSLLSKMVIRGCGYYENLGLGGDLSYLINKYLTPVSNTDRTDEVLVDREVGIFKDEDHKREVECGRKEWNKVMSDIDTEIFMDNLIKNQKDQEEE